MMKPKAAAPAPLMAVRELLAPLAAASRVGARLAAGAGDADEVAAERDARAGERDGGRLGLHAEGVGDLVGVQPVHLAQQQRRALRRRELPQRPVDLPQQVRLLVPVDGAGDLGRVVGEPRTGLGAPHVVVAGVDGDPVEPGLLLQLPGLAEALVGLQEHVLADVAGVVAVADQAQREVVHTDRMLAMQLCERGRASSSLFFLQYSGVSLRHASLRPAHPLSARSAKTIPRRARRDESRVTPFVRRRWRRVLHTGGRPPSARAQNGCSREGAGKRVSVQSPDGPCHRSADFSLASVRRGFIEGEEPGSPGSYVRSHGSARGDRRRHGGEPSVTDGAGFSNGGVGRPSQALLKNGHDIVPALTQGIEHACRYVFVELEATHAESRSGSNCSRAMSAA